MKYTTEMTNKRIEMFDGNKKDVLIVTTQKYYFRIIIDLQS